MCALSTRDLYKYWPCKKFNKDLLVIMNSYITKQWHVKAIIALVLISKSYIKKWITNYYFSKKTVLFYRLLGSDFYRVQNAAMKIFKNSERDVKYENQYKNSMCREKKPRYLGRAARLTYNETWWNSLTIRAIISDNIVLAYTRPWRPKRCRKCYTGGPRVPHCCTVHRCAKDKRRLLKNRAQLPNPGLISSHRCHHMTAQQILYHPNYDYYCILHKSIPTKCACTHNIMRVIYICVRVCMYLFFVQYLRYALWCVLRTY